MYYFDLYGWYTSTPIAGRSTDISPDNIIETTTPGEMRANFTGYEWVDLPYQAPAPAPPPVPEPQRITRLAFRNRFTAAEKVALEIAALDNPAAAMPARAQAAALRANQADLAAATFVDLQRADTRAGVQMLEAAGLLAAGRALQILDAPVEAHERPTP